MSHLRRVMAALVALGSVALVHPARAQEPAVFDAADIGIAAQPFHITSPVNARFGLRLPATVTSGSRIEFLLHRRVASRDSFRAIADHFAEPGVIDSVSVPLSRAVRSNGTTSFDVLINTVKSGANDLYLQQTGIYPLTINAYLASGELLASTLTFLDRRDATTPDQNVPTTVFASLTAPTSHSEDGTIAIDDQARVAVQQFTRFLTTVRSPATLQVQPELLESLAKSPDPYDNGLFEDLRAALAGHGITIAPYLPVDVAAFVHDGLSTELTAQIDLGEKTLNRLLPGVTIHRSTWVAHDSLDGASVTALSRLGINSFIMLPGSVEETQREKASGYLSRPSGNANTSMSLISADDALASTIDSPSDDTVRVGIRVAAEVLSRRDELVAEGGSPNDIRLMVTSSTGEITDPALMASAASYLANSPGISLQDLGGLQAVNDRFPATVFPQGTDRTLGGLRSPISQTRRELTAIGSMLPEDDPRRATWSELLAVASATNTVNPSDYINSLRSELRRLTGAVTLVTPETVTLSSRNGSIRLQLRNAEETSLLVRVVVSSPKVTFSGQPDVVELLPGSTTDVKISLRARTNGRFPISVRVVTPTDQVQVVSPAVVTARVTAVAGLGQLVSITLLLMLLAWWWTSRRRTQRAAGAEGTVSDQ